MKQPEWQRGGICGALSSKSQQLNLEPSEQRERERAEGSDFYFRFCVPATKRAPHCWVLLTGA